MANINKDNLAHYLKLGYNVLFIGRHGVGKTAIITETFENAGLRWKYFSASTLDPWVDFVGIPRVIEDENGKPRLQTIRPDFIEHDEVEAIFLDEYNRAPDKVINATMELIQFGSINGHKLKNLKVVWAAINPEDSDDTYSVNHIDPAQLDRFQVHIDVPYKVDEDFFMKKYPDHGRIFIDWWKDLPKEIRYLVSPRRLDYAADAYENKCRLEDFLPVQSNPKALRDLLKTLPFLEKIKNVSDEKEAIKFLGDVNNTMKMLDLLRSNETTVKEFFTKYAKNIPKELAAPFIECIQAKKAGFEVFQNLEEMIEKLPGDKGSAEIGALINNVNLGLMYSESSLEVDIKILAKTKKHVLVKLANRISDIILSCTHQTVSRMLWGPGGKKSNNPQNLLKLLRLICQIDDVISARDKALINQKLLSNQIIDSPL